jgi:hypothetical protein
MTVTTADIGNRALQLIGTRTTVSAAELIAGNTNEALQINIALTPIENWCYGLANWNFARKTVALTKVLGPPPANPASWISGTYPSPPWLYEYTLPADFIRAIYLTNIDAASTQGFLGEPKRFQLGTDTIASVQQEVLLTNEVSALLIYTSSITDPTLWPWYFERLMVMALAQALCMPLAQDRRLFEELSISLEQQISISTQVNAAEGLLINDITPEWIQALGINYPYYRMNREQILNSPSRMQLMKQRQGQQGGQGQ